MHEHDGYADCCSLPAVVIMQIGYRLPVKTPDKNNANPQRAIGYLQIRIKKREKEKKKDRVKYGGGNSRNERLKKRERGERKGEKVVGAYNFPVWLRPDEIHQRFIKITARAKKRI